jgi:hypothetical protein
MSTRSDQYSTLRKNQDRKNSNSTNTTINNNYNNNRNNSQNNSYLNSQRNNVDREEDQEAENNNSILNTTSPNNRNESKNLRNTLVQNRIVFFAKKNPVFTVLIAAVILVLIVLAIVLPATLIKKREERAIKPQCPDGKLQPRIDCLPDKDKFSASGTNLESICSSRRCCWNMGGDPGAPACSFPYNFGYREYKNKESTFSTQWLELLRMNSPNSMAKSEIANLEVKVEMHTDNRLRIRVSFQALN